jgi:hypothetical protein
MALEQPQRPMICEPGIASRLSCARAPRAISSIQVHSTFTVTSRCNRLI